MTTPDAGWKGSLQSFFDERARSVSSRPGFDELCFVSGRDPRLWQDDGLYEDLIASIVDAIGADRTSSVAEVGCAAGFLAYGVAPRVGLYKGIDLAANALAAARRLGLSNASFLHGDAHRLPLPDASIDAVFCYDVVTNFPTFADYSGLIAEMLRVVRPGGRVLVGSVPDRAVQADYERRVHEFAKELELRFGPAPASPVPPAQSWFGRLLSRLGPGSKSPAAPPAISCFYFDRADFEAFAKRHGVTLSITDIHARNPYAGCRFNAIFRRPD
jgi:SAM-dependent methyltransferase